jgi:hypothetical protein
MISTISSVVVITMDFKPEACRFEPHLRRYLLFFFLFKMRQKVKKYVSNLPEGEEKIILEIFNFTGFDVITH